MNALEDRLRAALAAKSDAVTWDETRHETEVMPAEVIRLVPEHPGRPQRRIAAALAAVAAAVVLALAVGTLVAGRGDGSSTDRVGNRTEVPWSQVGTDWTLIVTTSKSSDDSGTLYLVDPSGRHYLISSLPSQFLLVDRWSLGTGHALVTKAGFHSKDSNEVLMVDLRTGSQRKLIVPFNYNRVQFVDADQHLILANSPFQMLTLTDTGQRVSTFPGSWFWGSVISADGSQVVAGSPAGLNVFDIASGRRIQTLAPPAGYRDCAAVYAASPDSDVTGSCYSRTQENVVADFSFSLTNSHPPVPEPVPPGWITASFSRGVVAIEHNTTGRYEPRDVRFARVGASGRLVPLTLPTQLRHVGWSIESVGVDSFLLEHTVGRSNPTVDELARWNPLTGKFVLLWRARPGDAGLTSYAGWQAAPPL